MTTGLEPKQHTLPRRVLLGGICAGATYLFARVLTSGRVAEASLGRVTAPRTPPAEDSPPPAEPVPFTHYVEQAQITVMAGEPVVCDVLTKINNPATPITYRTDYTVSMTHLRSGKEALPAESGGLRYYGRIWFGAVLPDPAQSGSRLYYTANRAFDLTKPGTYRIDFHANMPWRRFSEQQMEDVEVHKQWVAVGMKNKEPMPVIRDSDAPFTPHEETVSVTVQVLPAATVPLRESARRQARELCRLLLDDRGEGVRSFEKDRAAEAFWCYPDPILLPAAKDELLPLKQMLVVAASEDLRLEDLPEGQDADRLSGISAKAYGAVSRLIHSLDFPQSTVRRVHFLIWLTQDVREGKNKALWFHIEPVLKRLENRLGESTRSNTGW